MPIITLTLLLACASQAPDIAPPSLKDTIELLQEQIEHGQPHGENAWPLLNDAAEILTDRDHHAYLDTLFRLNWQPSDDIERREHERATKAYPLFQAAGVPELIDQAIARPRMVVPLDDWDGTFPLVLRQPREVSEFLRAMMREAIEADDAQAAVHHFSGELTLAEFTSHQPGLISTLVSIAIINSAAEELRARLVSDSLPTQVCQPMIERINRLALAPTTKILESELLMTRALFGRHFDETGQIPEAIRPELAATLHAAQSSGIAAILDFTDETSDFEQVDLDQWRFPTWHEFDAWLTKAITDLSQHHHLPLNQWPATTETDHQPERIAFADIVPTVRDAAEKILWDRAIVLLHLRGTSIMLALHLYHSHNNTWPESLDQLVPEFLPQLPTDLANGGQFGYRLLQDDPHDRPYLLYSFGLDGTDDAGHQPENPRERYQAISRDTAPGADFVINEPRDPRL